MTIPPPNFPPPEGNPNIGSQQGPPPPDGPQPPRGRSGCVLGGLAAALYCVLLVAIALQSDLFAQVIIYGALAGVALGTAAIASDKLRPYAAGFLGGIAAVVIVLGGACVALLASLNGGPS